MNLDIETSNCLWLLVIVVVMPFTIELNDSRSSLCACACATSCDARSRYRLRTSKSIINKNTKIHTALPQGCSGGQTVTTAARKASTAMYVPTGGYIWKWCTHAPKRESQGGRPQGVLDGKNYGSLTRGSSPRTTTSVSQVSYYLPWVTRTKKRSTH